MFHTGIRRAAMAAVVSGALIASSAGAAQGASLRHASPGHSRRNPIGLPGDFDGDGEADIAIVVPKEDVGSVVDAGAVNVLYGSGGGPVSDANQFWNQDSAAILGTAAKHDNFGYALAAGDFGVGSQADLAVGAPYGDEPGATDAGAVNVIYGTPGAWPPRATSSGARPRQACRATRRPATSSGRPSREPYPGRFERPARGGSSPRPTRGASPISSFGWPMTGRQ